MIVGSANDQVTRWSMHVGPICGAARPMKIMSIYSLLLCLLLSAGIGTFLVVASTKILILGIAIIIAIVISYQKPEYILYLLMAAIIMTTETIGPGLEDSEGYLLIADLKVTHGVRPPWR